MDANKRIYDLMQARGWSEYKLAKKSNLSQSTISTLFRKNTLPSIPTVEAVCKALGITMAQFFTPEDETEAILLTPKQREIIDKYSNMPPKTQKAFEDIMDDFLTNT